MKKSLLFMLFLSMSFSVFADVDQRWITNLNEPHGFSIAYPRELQANSQFTNTYLLTNNWSQSIPGEGSPILEILLTPKRSYTCGDLGQCYYFSSIRIGMSQTKEALENCQKAPEGALSHSEETINGAKFSTYQAQHEAMMQYAKIDTYAVLHNNACYHVEFIQTGTNSTDSVSMHWKKDDQNLAGHIIQTFLFLNLQQ